MIGCQVLVRPGGARARRAPFGIFARAHAAPRPDMSVSLAPLFGSAAGLLPVARPQNYVIMEKRYGASAWVYICFPAGTPVTMDDGIAAIEDVRPGDRVLDIEGRWSTVSATRGRSYTGPMIELRAWGRPTLRLTAEHPVYVARRSARLSKAGGCRSWDVSWAFEWVAADAIAPGG